MMTDAGIAEWLRNYADRREHKDGMHVLAGKLRDAADAIEGKERQSAAPAQGTVRVRIACGVKADGSWFAIGAGSMADPMSVAMVMAGQNGRAHYITADLPLPAAQEIAGRVEAYNKGEGNGA